MLSIRTVVSALIILAICNLETPGQLLGQVSLPLKVDDAVRTQILSEVSPLALSPDGRRLAYMVQESGVIRPLKDSATETYIRTGVYVRNQAGNILLTDLETLETKNLTNGIGSNWEPRWSPDGRYLAFLSNRDGSRQAKIWIWDSFSGGLRMVSDVCVRAVSLINRLTWTPDSKHVLITVIPEGMSVESYENFVLSPAIELSTATAIVPGSSVILYEGNAAGPATNKEPSATPLRLDSQFLHDLVLVDVTTGQRTVIVHGKWIRWYELSPDGTQVAYTSLNEFSRERSLNLPCDVISVHLFSKKERILASHVRAFGLSWSPDSKTISYGAYAADDRTYDYYVVDAGEGHPRPVSALPGPAASCCQLGNPMWAPEGAYFYFLRDGALWRTSIARRETLEWVRIPNRRITYRVWQSDGAMWTRDGGKSTVVIANDEENKRDGFYKIDLQTRRSEKLLEQDKCYSCKWNADVNSFVVSTPAGVGEIAYVAEDAKHAPDIWVSDSEFVRRQQVTHLNPQFEKYAMGTAQVIEWLSMDGESMRGALLLPPDYERGKQYPLIVWSYPQARESNRFNRFGFGSLLGPMNMQLYATRGYAVLFADAHGETGSPRVSLAKSVLPGVNKVIEMGVADPNRIGLIGHSSGGFATLALLTQTRRFKAAVEVSGYGDFVSSYGVMLPDGSAYRKISVEGLLGAGGPWQFPLRYFENSPVFHLDSVDTPLLMVHGEADEDVAAFLADEIFVDLRELGKQVEYAKYQGESHAPRDWSYANQMDLANRIIAWFDSHLKATGL